jgi:hypothetical protein
MKKNNNNDDIYTRLQNKLKKDLTFEIKKVSFFHIFTHFLKWRLRLFIYLFSYVFCFCFFNL